MKIKNEYGLTLIELLLALAISMMIIGLIYGVLINSVGNFNKTQGHIQLRQEANIILAEITKAHHHFDRNNNQYIPYTLAIDHETLKLNGNPLTTKPISFDVKIGTNHFDPNFSTITITHENKLLYVELTLFDNANNEFTLQTIINRLQGEEVYSNENN